MTPPAFLLAFRIDSIGSAPNRSPMGHADPVTALDHSPAAEARRRALALDLTCPDLVDALGRRHRHRAHLLDLVSPTPGRILFGRAATISYFPTCAAAADPAEYSFGALYDRAVGEDPQGRVLVLASNGHRDTSLAGGTKLTRLGRDGVAGLLADGRIRDFDELREQPFVVRCTGEAVRAGGQEVTPYLADVPVVVGGVAVLPGQYVFADDSGAVVIPAEEVDAVLEGAAAVRAEDAGYREDILGDR